VRSGLLGGAINPVGRVDPDEFVAEASRGRLLVAPGFCQKPFGCPAGRFNHDCIALGSSLLYAEASGQGETLPPCRNCYIYEIGSLAIQAGASVYIMTSALDIGRHILLPSLEDRRFTHILACVCPYSAHPFTLALEICGLRGYVVTFARGACADYAAWARADEGIKPEQTSLAPEGDEWIRKLLEECQAHHDCGGKRIWRRKSPAA